MSVCTVSINRKHVQDSEEPTIKIVIREGRRRATVTMSAADFALTLTGASERPGHMVEVGTVALRSIPEATP